jgi:hypothetical protein
MGYVSVRSFWTLDFQHTGLRYITINDPVTGNAVVPYTTYKVTNNTGEDRDFQPLFQVETDTKQLTFAIPSPVAAAQIDKKHGEKFLDIDKIAGTIKAGETKQGVAIFRTLDAGADKVKVYVSGLSNAYRYQDPDARKGFQRRIYFIEWYRPGDAKNRPEDKTETKHDDWIWRSTGTAESAPEGE